MRTRLYVVLLVLITLASAARWPAVWYSYPFEGFVDEPYLVEIAYKMAREADPNPHFFNYGSLSFYGCATVYLLADLCGTHSLTPDYPSPDHFVLARQFALVLATAAIPATAEIGRRLVGPVVGLAGACFLAVAPLYTTFSYMATINPALTFWSALAGVATVLVYTRGRTGDYVLAGVLAGMTVGTKYVGFTAALLPVLAHLLAARRGAPRPLRPLLITAALVPVVFLLTTPFALLDLEQFLKDLARTGHVYNLEGMWNFHEAEGDHSWYELAHRMTFRGFRALPMALAAVGTAWLFWKDWRRAALLVTAPLVAWLFLGSYRAFFPRNLLGVLPYLALLAGCGIHAVHETVRGFLPRAPALGGVAALLLFGWALSNPLAETLATIEKDMRVDTRRAAFEWVTANVPPGARILREERTPPLEEMTDAYDVLGYRSIVHPDRRDEAETFDYVMITIPFRRVVKLGASYAEDRAMYAEFMSTHELVAKFDPRGGELTGRRIEIYRIVR
jgi:4-amino-4-deoxy-L-arabinose transferase-like glycosyltransferase